MLRIACRSLFGKSMSELTVVHDETKRRFVGTFANTPGQSYMEYRFITPTFVDFFRTVTEPELRGKGAAGEVVQKAFLWAQAKKLQVKPTCSYVEAFAQKNPQFGALIIKYSTIIDQIAITREGRRRKFVARLGDLEVCYMQYRKLCESDSGSRNKQSIEFYHTETLPEFRGKAVAQRVVNAALDWALSEGFIVLPTCSYVKKIADQRNLTS